MTGDNIKKLRQERGLTVKKTAQELGISQPYLSTIEAGKKNPSKELLAKMSAFFGKPESEIFDGKLANRAGSASSKAKKGASKPAEAKTAAKAPAAKKAPAKTTAVSKTTAVRSNEQEHAAPEHKAPIKEQTAHADHASHHHTENAPADHASHHHAVHSPAEHTSHHRTDHAPAAHAAPKHAPHHTVHSSHTAIGVETAPYAVIRDRARREAHLMADDQKREITDILRRAIEDIENA